MKKKNQSKSDYLDSLPPFNFCDRNCERCEDFRGKCKAYQEESQFKLQCVMNGKDPSDPRVVFDHVGKVMSSTLEMLKKKMKEKGLEINEEDVMQYEEQENEREDAVNKHPLFEKCSEISDELDEFLSEFQITLPDMQYTASSLARELKELYFYVPMICAKTGRALFSKIEEEEGFSDEYDGYSDSLVSAALGYRSLCTVNKSLANIRDLVGSNEIIWMMKINTLQEGIGEAQKIFEDTFAGIEKFSKKIIFHGRHN